MKKILSYSVWSTLSKNTSNIFLLKNLPIFSRQSRCENHFYKGASCTSMKKLKAGMTLVELLLAMGIISILMTVIFGVFMQVIEMKLNAEAESAIAEDSRYIYSRLAYDINRADSIVTPTVPGDTSDSLILTIGGTNYTYMLNGTNQLTIDDGTGEISMNSAGTTVSSLNFSKVAGSEGAESVKVEIELESVTERVQGSVQDTIKTTIGTR